MRQAVVGMLAHVDAGKTTLAEAMLFAAGAIITIFSKQTSLDYNDVHLMLLDAPGHVDFSAEAERTLMALDYAVLVIGANDGVQGHTETLWELLGRYGIPAFIFINKLDLAGTERAAVTDELARRLDAACLSGEELLGGGAACEDAAATDEAALDEYLEGGALSRATLRRLVRDMGLAVVLVTHDLAVARLLSHRLMVMYHGEVVEQGLADQVLDDPHHPYTQLLVSSILQG